MKRFTRFLIAVMAMPLMFGGLVGAQQNPSTPWRIQMSDPTTADQLRSFNIEFTALSVEPTDRITVQLLQTGSPVGDPVVTQDRNGGSGVFRVTVPEDGIYVYNLEASSRSFEDTKTTDSRTVRVSTPEDEITIIEVGPDLTPEEEAALIEAGAAAGPGADAAADTEVEGEITDEAAVTDEDGEVLGVDDDDEEDENGEVLGIDDEEAIGWLAGGLLVAALAAALWYVFRRRRNADAS